MRTVCMPRFVRRPFDNGVGVGVGRDLAAERVQELLHALQAFGRWIDRAQQHRCLALAGSVCPQRDDEVLQLERRPPAVDATDAARGVGRPGFGRTGQHDVFRFGVVEHVAHAGQTGQKLHLIAGRLIFVEPFFHGRFQPVERNLAKFAGFGQFGVEVGLGFGDALFDQSAARIGKVLQAQHAVGVDDHAVGPAGARAAGTATGSAAAADTTASATTNTTGPAADTAGATAADLGADRQAGSRQ